MIIRMVQGGHWSGSTGDKRNPLKSNNELKLFSEEIKTLKGDR